MEGLEFAPGSTTTAYLGFRAPLAPAVPGGKALVVTVTNIDQVVAGKAKPVHSGSADLYGDGTEAKDLDHPEWKKSRAAWFRLN